MVFIFFVIGVIITAIWIDYKISTIVRIFAYKDNESKKESILSFIGLIISSIFWASYLYFWK